MRVTQRLDKVLANLGYGTRTEVRKLIKDGSITVGGRTVSDPGMHVDPENSLIEVSGKKLDYRRYSYYMMNKPAGVISATFDPKHKTVIDLLPEMQKRMGLFPVGRLDIDTEGLLLLTNNGELAHNLLSPKKHVSKRYYALVAGFADQYDVTAFKEGIVLEDGFKTMPADLEVIRQGNTSEIELTIYEGKFHQVKRMFEAVGKRVIYLKRMAMGSLLLDESLKTGEFRELTEEEQSLLSTGTAAGELE